MTVSLILTAPVLSALAFGPDVTDGNPKSGFRWLSAANGPAFDPLSDSSDRTLRAVGVLVLPTARAPVTMVRLTYRVATPIGAFPVLNPVPGCDTSIVASAPVAGNRVAYWVRSDGQQVRFASGARVLFEFEAWGPAGRLDWNFGLAQVTVP
jgi:hypothetical protein